MAIFQDQKENSGLIDDIMDNGFDNNFGLSIMPFYEDEQIWN